MIADFISPDKTVLDIGCGTGELVFRLARQASMVTGVDLNDEMLTYSRLKQKKGQVENVEFISKDVNNLDFLFGSDYDYVILSMFLHQFSVKEANQLLAFVQGIARHIILADFIHPLPNNLIGWGAKMIERIAGGDHYLHFKEYQKQGGLNYYLDYHSMTVMEKKLGGLGIIQMIKTVPETRSKR